MSRPGDTRGAQHGMRDQGFGWGCALDEAASAALRPSAEAAADRLTHREARFARRSIGWSA
jgi:hypothetical protein